MTNIQVNYLQHLEQQRHNMATEAAQREQNRINALNADIQQKKVDNDFILGQRNLDISQGNLDLGWFAAQNNYTLGLENVSLGYTNANNQLYNYENQASYNQAYLSEVQTHNIVMETIEANPGMGGTNIRNIVLASQRAGSAANNATDQAKELANVGAQVIKDTGTGLGGLLKKATAGISSVVQKVVNYGNSRSVDWSTIY